MPIGIVEVINNTGSVLHYKNQESGYAFDVNPTIPSWNDDGYIACSKFHDDTVPFETSNKKIVVNVDNGGPQFTVVDNNWRFHVICDTKSFEMTNTFSNGDQFVMKVDKYGMQLFKYVDGLQALDQGFLTIKGNSAYTNALASPTYSMKLRS